MPDFLYGLNTSTIRPASLREKIEITGTVGYDAIELWADDVEKYQQEGGRLADVAKMLDDQGLKRPSMICLRGWIQADPTAWQSALDAAKKRLEMARTIGVERIVASPPGEEVNLDLATERYEELLELSLNIGCPASVEFLGFVKGINTLEKAWAIAAGTGNSQATVTPDVWHMFRGGTNFATLNEIPGDHISCFHWNDAPKEPERLMQTDAHRVYPKDGMLDLAAIADQLRAKDWHGCLSLELFNPSYWSQDPVVVARTGLEKMKASVQRTT